MCLGNIAMFPIYTSIYRFLKTSFNSYLHDHLKAIDTLERFQSAYRAAQSAETLPLSHK